MSDCEEIVVSGDWTNSNGKSEKTEEQTSFAIDLKFVKRCFHLLRIMFPRILCPTLALFALLLVLSFVDQVASYQVGILPSQFYAALGPRDSNLFRHLAWKSSLVVLGKVAALATIKYLGNVLYVSWRRLLCNEMHRLYFSNRAYYEMNVMEKNSDLDNPDQRMTQDVDRMCYCLSDIFWPLTISPFVIGYYTYKTYASTGWVGPVMIYCYFFIGTIVNRTIMNRLVDWNARREHREGDFRFFHMSIRSNTESVAFSRGEETEKVRADQSLNRLLRVQQRLINWEYILQLATDTFDYMGSILIYLILGFVIFGLGSYEDKDAAQLAPIISKSAFIYMYLVGSFSKLIDLSVKFSIMAGNAHRVAQLFEHMQTYHEDNQQQGKGSEEHGNSDWSEVKPEESGTLVKLKNISYNFPDSTQLLVENLNVTIRKGERVLITGDSSAGKTTLLRVLCGLHGLQSGSVEWDMTLFTAQDLMVMFLPQEPYFTTGTLLQQLVYPHLATSVSPVHVIHTCFPLLNLVNLEYLMSRILCVRNWSDELTPGEMQRLCFVRVLYHKPRLVFLDEATSSLGIEMEAKLYTALKDAGIEFCSVGHRDSLRRFHELELHLDRNGSYSLSKICDRSGTRC